MAMLRTTTLVWVPWEYTALVSTDGEGAEKPLCEDDAGLELGLLELGPGRSHLMGLAIS
jgi:hypothetical protein